MKLAFFFHSRDIDRQNRHQAAKDYQRRARLGPEKLPSICFYTILNSYNIVNCCDISDDSTWIVLGLSDSTVRVCSLADKMKLKVIKQLQDLELLDKESGNLKLRKKLIKLKKLIFF